MAHQDLRHRSRYSRPPHQYCDEAKRLTTELAQNNIKKSYGDVTSEVLVLEFPDPTNEAEVKRILRDKKLNGTLEEVKAGYYFYNPDSGDYRTRSKPKEIQAEQGGTEQPATRPELKSEDSQKPQPESEGRSR